MLLVARGQPPVADFGMANPFHRPLPSQDPRESSALESAENSDSFDVKKNMYVQLAQNIIADQPPPPFLYGTLLTVIIMARHQFQKSNQIIFLKISNWQFFGGAEIFFGPFKKNPC